MNILNGCKASLLNRLALNFFRSVLFSLFVSIVLSAALPTATLADEFQFSYPITGTNAQELIDQIQDNTHSPDGAFGYTELNTKVGWTATVSPDGVCSVVKVDFSYDITIYMPQWVDRDKAKACLQKNWDLVWYEIQVHEEQHRKLYRLLDVEDIKSRIAAIRPRASCDVLKSAINAEVEMILDENDKLHDKFHAASASPVLSDC